MASISSSAHWMYNPSTGFYPYEIDGSLMFDDGNPSQLSRTPATAGNRKTWTWSGWVKRTNLTPNDNYFKLFSAGSHFTNNAITSISLSTYTPSGLNDTIVIGAGVYAVVQHFEFGFPDSFRDTSSWYHIVVAMDTTQASDANRCKVWVNGRLLSGRIGFAGRPTTITQNYDTAINSTAIHNIGGLTAQYSTDYLDGYLAEINFIDGQALDVSSFGQTKSGVWVPKEYAGTYGTNGFYLKFDGNANDSSGNGNNWSTSGVNSYDYGIDSPTNNGPIANPLTVSGNMTILQGGKQVAAQAYGRVDTTIGFPSTGKYYWEYLSLDPANITRRGAVGIAENGVAMTTNNGWNLAVFPYASETMGYTGFDGNVFGSDYDGSQVIQQNHPTWWIGDIISLAVDCDNRKIFYAKNGVWLNSGDPAAGTGNFGLIPEPITRWCPAFGTQANVNGYPSQGIANFGSDSSFLNQKSTGSANASDANGIGNFYYTPPAGYLALCTANLPEPAISPADDESPSDYFNTVLYTGNGGTNNVTGVGFQPDWVWIKSRSQNEGHRLFDVVRGVQKMLFTNGTGTELTSSLTSFDSDGFTLTGNTYSENNSGSSLVAWNWKAGGTGVSNTAGSITSTVSANQDAGFSIVSYTAQASGTATVGHGLAVAPAFIIVKPRTTTINWNIYHKTISPTQYILFTTGGGVTSSVIWNNTAATSSVFSLGTGWAGTGSAIAYCFAEIEGYSKFGSYNGNNNADGPFVYTGFRPAFVITKASGTTGNWALFDSTRDASNDNDLDMFYVNSSLAESAFAVSPVDLLSNGFKIRHTTGNGYANASATHIYIAFAENPFKYANAR